MHVGEEPTECSPLHMCRCSHSQQVCGHRHRLLVIQTWAHVHARRGHFEVQVHVTIQIPTLLYKIHAVSDVCLYIEVIAYLHLISAAHIYIYKAGGKHTYIMFMVNMQIIFTWQLEPLQTSIMSMTNALYNE